jgi:hypothetical protein
MQRLILSALRERPGGDWVRGRPGRAASFSILRQIESGTRQGEYFVGFGDTGNGHPVQGKLVVVKFMQQVRHRLELLAPV